MSSGTFISGCICDSELRTLNLTLLWVEFDPEKAATCDQLDIHGVEHFADPLRKHGEPDRPKIRGSVAEELGWCRCGNNERIDELMLTFLSWLEERTAYWSTNAPTEGTPTSGLDDDVELLLAYIATERNWTEHGSMVPGWLTENGVEVLANLRKPEYGVG